MNNIKSKKGVTSKIVKDAIDNFAWQEYCSSGLRKVNGGYCDAKIYDHDEEYFYFELTSGTQNMGDGCSSCNKYNFKMDRFTLEIEND